VTEPHITASGTVRRHGRRGVLAGGAALGAAIFALLWLLNIRYRQVYVPRLDDVTALADGLLMLPGAQWQDWFTQGHSHFFDAYPEWPWGLSAFARPVFQFAIYLAHFIFGRDWASYLAINYLSVAGPAVVAFVIAQNTLKLALVPSLTAAGLTLFAPAVTEFSIWELGFGSEPLASFFVGCGFLALVSRRHFLCVLLLTIALLTKETAVWAPLAAALTVLVRPGRRRVFAAAAMLLPIVVWLAMRFSFFGGIGGTYASPHYSPVSDFLAVTGWKLTHFHHLLVSRDYSITEGHWLLLDRAARIGVAGFVLLLLGLWALGGAHAARMAVGALRRRQPIEVSDALLATLWGAIGLAFYFALTLPDLRYATSAVMFLWPALVAGAVRHRNSLLRWGLAACLLISLYRGLHFIADMNPPPPQSNTTKLFKAVVAMNNALEHLPPGIDQVFVVSAGDDLSDVAPQYLQAFLDVKAEIVRVIDMDWDCDAPGERVVFDHKSDNGVVMLQVALPDCAHLQFEAAILDGNRLVDGHLRRSDEISYELPEARAIEHRAPRSQVFDLGRRMTAAIRLKGPARFIIEPAGPDGGLVCFDVP
jgi:hypothetical protein